MTSHITRPHSHSLPCTEVQKQCLQSNLYDWALKHEMRVSHCIGVSGYLSVSVSGPAEEEGGKEAASLLVSHALRSLPSEANQPMTIFRTYFPPTPPSPSPSPPLFTLLLSLSWQRHGVHGVHRRERERAPMGAPPVPLPPPRTLSILARKGVSPEYPNRQRSSE